MLQLLLAGEACPQLSGSGCPKLCLVPWQVKHGETVKAFVSSFFYLHSTCNKLRQQYYTFEYDLGLWPFGAVQVIKATVMAVLQR